MVGALARSLSRVQMAFLAAQQALCLDLPREEENVIIRSKPGEEPWIMTVAINLSADMLLWLKSATPSERARQRCVLRRSSCSSVCRAVFSRKIVYTLFSAVAAFSSLVRPSPDGRSEIVASRKE